ncbi:hypothetical protein [Gemmatimonas aurantiaca]|uniref:hypothetical protein n=1 Tax=Gemmatimonas aurantiaca TaxID=173480 RepID=UPI00301C056F
MTSFRLLGRFPVSRAIGAGAALAIALSACSEANERLLGVVDPDIINPSDITNAEGAIALGNGALNSFREMTAANETSWLFGGLLADEWSTSSTFIQNDETDQRRVAESNSSVTLMLRYLYRTRTRSNEALGILRELSPTSRALMGELYLARGYAELQLASDFCNGIPMSNSGKSDPVNEEQKSTQQVFQYAAASLDSAIAMANGADAASVQINQAARIVRARIALALGAFTEAAPFVSGIPSSFAYRHTFSNTAGNNILWSQGLSSRRYSVGDSVEGNSRDILVTNAIPFASARDPRLPVTIPTSGAINGQDGQTYTRTTGMWQQLTPVDVANGVDARMIEAEAALRAGNVTEWLSIHNALRAAPPKLGEIQPAAMPALVDPGTEAGRVSLHFREKAFWTFGRGQRLGDMRRLIKQYGRTQQQVFPQGVHYKGGNYGTDVNLPITQAEQNNPNFKSCTDRNP